MIFPSCLNCLHAACARPTSSPCSLALLLQTRSFSFSSLVEPETAAYWYAFRQNGDFTRVIEHPHVRPYRRFFRSLVEFVGHWKSNVDDRLRHVKSIARNARSITELSCMLSIFSMGPWTSGYATPDENGALVDFIVSKIEGIAKRVNKTDIWRIRIVIWDLESTAARIHSIDHAQGQRADRAIASLYSMLPVDPGQAEAEASRTRWQREISEDFKVEPCYSSISGVKLAAIEK